MLPLKSTENLSQQIYEAIEKQFQMSLGKAHSFRWGLSRKALYLMYLGCVHLSDFTSAPYPVIKKERKKVLGEMLDMVSIRMRIANRRKAEVKTLTIPIFLDSAVDRTDNSVVLFEQAAWEIVTDSWAFPETRVDFSKLGGYNPAKQSLSRILERVKLKCIGPLDKTVEKPLRLQDLRQLRLYDLLKNKREEYGLSSDMVAKMLGFASSEWLVRSEAYKLAFRNTDAADLLTS